MALPSPLKRKPCHFPQAAHAKEDWSPQRKAAMRDSHSSCDMQMPTAKEAAKRRTSSWDTRHDARQPELVLQTAGMASG